MWNFTKHQATWVLMCRSYGLRGGLVWSYTVEEYAVMRHTSHEFGFQVPCWTVISTQEQNYVIKTLCILLPTLAAHKSTAIFTLSVSESAKTIPTCLLCSTHPITQALMFMFFLVSETPELTHTPWFMCIAVLHLSLLSSLFCNFGSTMFTRSFLVFWILIECQFKLHLDLLTISHESLICS